jgi:hypothetical protein
MENQQKGFEDERNCKYIPVNCFDLLPKLPRAKTSRKSWEMER